MKNPTTRKIRNRGLTPIRYWTGGYHSQVRYGWMVSEGKRGTMVVRLVGDSRNKRLTQEETRHVTKMP